MTTRPYSPAIAYTIDGWDGGDPWGSALAIGWALCEVARAAGVYEVLSTLDYHPGHTDALDLDAIAAVPVELVTAPDHPDLPDSLESYCLAVAYVAGDVTDADLIRGARVINRYLDLCKRAGLDY